MKSLKRLGTLAMASLVSGCATLFSPSTDTITVDSEPKGARVYLDDEYLGVTPLKSDVDRDVVKRRHIIVRPPENLKDAYESETMELKRTFNPVSLFNLGFIFTTLGVSSWGTDLISGKLIEYYPRGYFIELKKVEPPQRGAAAAHAPLTPEVVFFANRMGAFENELARGTPGETYAAYAELRGIPDAERSVRFDQLRGRISELAAVQSPVEFARLARE